MNERVAAMLELVDGPRVLNVGCTGHERPHTPERRARFLHARLVDQGLSVLGVDVDDAGLAWMRAEGYEVARADAQDLPALGRFDTIVAGELIEHLENPALFLDGCRRNLAADGRLVLSTPNVFAPLHVLVYAKTGSAANPEHACWFDRQTLTQLLERRGFAIEQFRFVDDLRTDDGSSPAYRVFARAWRRGRRGLPARFRHSLVVAASVGNAHS